MSFLWNPLSGSAKKAEGGQRSIGVGLTGPFLTLSPLQSKEVHRKVVTVMRTQVP